jgi:hypothetical protein
MHRSVYKHGHLLQTLSLTCLPVALIINTQSKHIIWRSGANNRWQKYLPIPLKYTMITNTHEQRFLRPRYNCGQLELYFSTAGYSTCQAVGRSVRQILCKFCAISMVPEVIPKITPIIQNYLSLSSLITIFWFLHARLRKIFDWRIHINRNLHG